MEINELLKYAKEQGLVISHKEALKLSKETNKNKFLRDLFKRKGILWRKSKEIRVLKEELLFCQICNKKFNKAISLWNHIRKHRNETYNLLEKVKYLEKELEKWKDEYFKLNMKKKSK